MKLYNYLRKLIQYYWTLATWPVVIKGCSSLVGSCHVDRSHVDKHLLYILHGQIL